MIIVLNANTLAVSEYAIDAVGLVVKDGVVYCVTTTALQYFSASGTDEGAVASSIQTGELTLLPGKRINIRLARLMLAADQALELSWVVDREGIPATFTYSIPAISSAQSRGRRIKFGRGLCAERWSMKLSTTIVDDVSVGGNWSLDYLSVMPGWRQAPA